jgi:hypothetical protein
VNRSSEGGKRHLVGVPEKVLRLTKMSEHIMMWSAGNEMLSWVLYGDQEKTKNRARMRLVADESDGNRGTMLEV